MENNVTENKYKKINDNDLIRLLYSNDNLITEMHLINLYNSLNKYPLIVSPEQLIRFKQYVEFCEHVIIQSLTLMKYCPAPPFFNNLENIKRFLKTYYHITEILDSNNKIIIIKIKENKYEIR